MTHWKNGRNKPVIGLAGGIGSGKSTIARFFADLGCAVIDSDALARQSLDLPQVKTALAAWLGQTIFNPDGSINRSAIAQKVFSSPDHVKKLNALVHPLVKEMRDQLMPAFLADPKIRAIVWDAPLLFEAGYDRDCDCVVFVNVPVEKRLERVAATRNWNAAELAKREKFQIPLDKKQSIADYCLDNSGEPASSRIQAQQVFSLILTNRT